MNNNEAVNIMYEAIGNCGLFAVMHRVYERNIKLRIGYSKALCDASIDTVALSVRSYNALMRAGYCTVGAVVDALNDGNLMKIRNLGKKSYNEICQKIIEYGYVDLTENEKKGFIAELISLNRTK